MAIPRSVLFDVPHACRSFRVVQRACRVNTSNCMANTDNNETVDYHIWSLIKFANRAVLFPNLHEWLTVRHYVFIGPLNPLTRDERFGFPSIFNHLESRFPSTIPFALISSESFMRTYRVCRFRLPASKCSSRFRCGCFLSPLIMTAKISALMMDYLLSVYQFWTLPILRT